MDFVAPASAIPGEMAAIGVSAPIARRCGTSGVIASGRRAAGIARARTLTPKAWTARTWTARTWTCDSWTCTRTIGTAGVGLATGLRPGPGRLLRRRTLAHVLRRRTGARPGRWLGGVSRRPGVLSLR